MVDFYSRLIGQLRAEEADERSRSRSVYSAKMRLLQDPDKLDKLAADMVAQLSPVTKKARKGKFVLESDAIDSAIPSDHPMKGFVYQYRDNLRKILMDPSTARHDIGELAHGTAMHMLTARPGGGAPTWLKSYEYKRREDAELLPWGKLDLRAPLFGNIPSYDEWLKYITDKEDIHFNTYLEGGKRYRKQWHHYSIASPGEMAIAGGVGATLGGLIGGPLGAGTLAATAVLGEIVAKPFRSMMEKTEWHRASASPLMISNTLADKAKGLGISVIPDLLLGGGIDAALYKAIRVPAGMVGRKVTAKTLTAARKAADDEFARLLKDRSFIDRMKLRFTHNRGRKLGWAPQDLWFIRKAKQWAGAGDKAAKEVVDEIGLALSEAATAAKEMPPIPPFGKQNAPDVVAKVFSSLDDIAQEQAINDTSGFVRGVYKAKERMDSRVLATKLGEMENMDELIGLRSREAYKGIKASADEFGIAVSKSYTPTELPKTFRPGKYMREMVSKNPYIVRTARFKPGKAMVEKMGESLESVEADPVVRKVVYDTSKPSKRAEEMGIERANTRKAVIQAKEIARPRGRPKTPEVSVEGAGERIAVPKGQEALAKELAEQHPSLFLEEEIKSIDAAEALTNEYGRMVTSGEITADDGLLLMDRLQNTVMRAAEVGDITDEGAISFLDSTDGFMSWLRQTAANKAILAMLGVTGLTVSFFLGEGTAEAGMASSFGKSIVKGIKNIGDLDAGLIALLRKGSESRYMVNTQLGKDIFYVPYEGFQIGLRDTVHGGPTNIMKNIYSYGRRGARESVRFQLMSPGQVADEVFDIGKNKMNNPAVWKASYQATEHNNTSIGHQVFANILEDSNIRPAVNEVDERFTPLIEGMMNQLEVGWRKDEVTKLDKQYKAWKKLKTQEDAKEFDLELNRSTLRNHVNRLQELEGKVEEFHRNWEVVAKEAAEEIPSVRISLAIDDTPDFKKYPFLKNVKFHPDELAAIGHIRKQLLVYKARLDEMKVPTIKGPYLPHILHPKFTQKMFENITGEYNAAAYMRFYRRSADSRPLFPDIHTTLTRYVSDIERRIQNQTFWNQGWDKVRAATQHIPGSKIIFDTLEAGVRPTDRTVSNKVAEFYTQVEVLKRLFLSPSAGGKHLVKMSANVVSTGAGETAEIIPLATKATIKRVLRANTELRGKLTSFGINEGSEQEKLIASLFNSLVPARNARQRLLDIGIDTPEEYFTGIKRVWQKVQNIGGAWINLAELVDRGVSVLAAFDITAKKGLTIEQALYAAYDLILRNNFLSRELNPGWLRSPKVRALFMFQGTPFKIMERRVVNAIRAGRSLNNMGKAVAEATKTPEGRKQLLRDLINLRAYVKEGEQQAKANIFGDALLQETDFLGTPIVYQFAKDVLMIGAATIGGSYAGANLMHHFFHLPFLSGQTYEPTMTLAVSPAFRAVTEGYRAYQAREEADDEFLFTKILQRWAGKAGPMPDLFHKYQRISENDIPERYDDSKFKYIFAIPAAGKH